MISPAGRANGGDPGEGRAPSTVELSADAGPRAMGAHYAVYATAAQLAGDNARACVGLISEHHGVHTWEKPNSPA